MSPSLSFSDRLKAGWTKEHVIKYYCMTEAQYERAVACVKRIEQEVV